MVKNQMFPIQCKIEAPYLNHELKTMFIELSFGWKQWSRQHLWCTTCIFQAGASIELSHWSTAGSTGLPIGRREQAICGVDNPHIIQKSLTLAVNGDHRLPHTLDIFDEKQIIPSFMSRVSHKTVIGSLRQMKIVDAFVCLLHELHCDNVIALWLVKTQKVKHDSEKSFGCLIINDYHNTSLGFNRSIY